MAMINLLSIEVLIMFATRELTTAFICFLKEAEICIYDKGTPINILDLFCFEEIIALRYVYSILLDTYVRFNCKYNKESFTPDPLMLKHFNGKLAMTPNGDVPLKYLRKFVKKEIIVASSPRPRVTSSILLLVLKCLFSYPKRIGKNIDIFAFIFKIKDKKDRIEFCEIIRKHPSANKLCFSIVLSDIPKIKKYMERYNPCSNYFRAYRLTIRKKGQDEIRDYVLDNIIPLYILYKEVLSQIGNDVFYHFVKLL